MLASSLPTELHLQTHWGRVDGDVQEAADRDKVKAWGDECFIPDSSYLLSGSAPRPSAFPLGATGSGAKVAGRSCLSVSLQPAWPFQPDFPATARDAVCWLSGGTQGHLPGEERSPNPEEAAKEQTNVGASSSVEFGLGSTAHGYSMCLEPRRLRVQSLATNQKPKTGLEKWLRG